MVKESDVKFDIDLLDSKSNINKTPLIGVLNPAITTSNLGDQIISDAVYRELNKMFPMHFFIDFPTTLSLTKKVYKRMKKTKYSFVGGTNILSSNFLKYKQWQLGIKDALRGNDVVLMGVGWWQYQKKPNLYTATILKRVLHKEILHSVRDEYTRQQLLSIGIKNVINTGCPTTWELTPDFCSTIPSTKGDSVVFTLTDYNKDKANDKEMIRLLVEHYQTVYFWPQGISDIEYFKNFRQDFPNIEIVPPLLKSYDKLLSNLESLDYVGTRLHGGIRALHRGKRSIIIGIDNRAKEMAKDIKLPVVNRGDIQTLKSQILYPMDCQLNIPISSIEQWKSQFK
ncbi:polysaccharide pyruvyl transferase family protein [Thermoflexibacter ruber]|uniref:Polysaccharide pyruvyl transferase n=1 Tax=Thermoflexibacter ruber TaxID=1003 RepID=A0A1I2IXU2_9BACT|nr:polysaccharide pyruvyl transferase family protein [Thermoflexibacter ruber]SFF45301.1 Polysaccharide pyruvyl transferase [Thermoflexibacter ruber]